MTVMFNVSVKFIHHIPTYTHLTLYSLYFEKKKVFIYETCFEEIFE